MAAPSNMLRSALRSGRIDHFCNHLLRKKTRAVGVLPKRCLHLQEYQSKELMGQHGISVQKFVVCHTPEEAKHATENLKVDEYVIKAQILAGGRGKGTFSNGFKGGVHLTKDANKVEEIVDNMLGYNLVTKQTTAEGVKVNKVMVAEALDIGKETYLAILLDRSFAGPVIIGSKHGGMDIEEMSEKDPDSIIKEPVDIMTGIRPEQAMSMSEKLGFQGVHLQEAADQITKLYNMFIKVDATQIEINPFGETPCGQVVCFDAKINFDDNAQFRQKAIFEMEDTTEVDPREVEAARHNLNYIGLEGSIGCLVNGAGLAMATMDIIKLHNGEPANFLDIGGGVSEQQVFDAFQILSADAHVKAILVNVFGGIVNCVTVATGIIKAAKKIHLSIPLVVRVDGNNSEAARDILNSSDLDVVVAHDLDDAAKLAVAKSRY